MKPLSDFVFLEKEKQKETKKGIILSDVSKSKPSVFVVVAAGPGKIDRHGNLVETRIKKGDKIVVDPFVVREVKVEGIDYLIIREEEIYGII